MIFINTKNITYDLHSSLNQDQMAKFDTWAKLVFSIMEKASGKQITKDINISVSPDFENPSTLPDKNPIQIKLSMGSLLYWAQEVYQLAHEYCHDLINSSYDPQRKDEWFEEVICECASRFVLIEISTTSLAAKELFSNHFIDYEKNLFKEETFVFEPKKLSNESFEVLAKLRANHEWREAERHLANLIMPIILEDKSFWKSVTVLASFKDENSFLDNLNLWYKKSPNVSKPQIAKIINLIS